MLDALAYIISAVLIGQVVYFWSEITRQETMVSILTAAVLIFIAILS